MTNVWQYFEYCKYETNMISNFVFFHRFGFVDFCSCTFTSVALRFIANSHIYMIEYILFTICLMTLHIPDSGKLKHS